MRVFQKPLLEALIIPATSRAHYAGKQPNASIEYGQSGGFSAGENDIGEAHLLDLRPGLKNALVKALEPAAQDGNAGAAGDLSDARLRDGFAARRHGEDRVPAADR